MATWELQLISRIVRSGDLNSVLEYGITLDDFLTTEGRGLFNALLGYHQMPETAGAVLGPYAVQRVFPNFQLCDDVSMPTVALCHEVRKHRLVIEFQARLQQQLDVVGMDPLAAINATQSAMTDLQNIGFSQNTDVHFHDSFSRSIRKMELIEAGVDLSCGFWPWMPLQDATGGIQPDDYVVIYGRPKSMKSWVIAYLLATMYEQRKRILVYTKEMTADNIFARAGACLASIRYQEFRRGKLSHAEKQSLYMVERMLHQARMQQTVICLSGQDATEGGDTVPWLKSKIETYKPDIVFVDGMYLMSDAKGAKKDNQRVMNISRALRQIPLKMEVPIISTIQANRKAAGNEDANTDEVAFSDSLSQDCTVLMRAINLKNEPTIALVMSGISREFHLNGFKIYGVPALNFEYFGPIDNKEIEKAKKADDEEEAKKGPKKDPLKNKKPTEAQSAKGVMRHPAYQGMK